MWFRRRPLLLARSALALFVLMQLVSVAAPLVQPPHGEPICTADGAIEWVDEGHGEQPAPAHLSHGIHCPLCVPAGGPPSTHLLLAPTQPPPEAWRHFERTDARVAFNVRAPLPPRGPPAFS